MKACLCAYFRFSRGVGQIATEVGEFNSDFLAIRKGNMFEIEIKTSKADLNADFKKRKHTIYEQDKSVWTPNYFYFAVPNNLVEYAFAKCVDNNYGVLEILESGPWKERVRVVKRAKKLHNRFAPEKVKYYLINRLSSEMANLRINEQLNK